MRPTFLLLALTTLLACDDGKIDLGEWEDGGADADDDASPDTGNESGSDDDNRPVDTGNSTEDTGATDTADSVVPINDIDGDGFTIAEGDCDDNDASVFPGAREQCDDIDHDCDGQYYNGLLVQYDMSISDSWSDPDFPSLVADSGTYTTSELWIGYRDYNTDLNSYGESALEYTGTIRPAVLKYEQETEDHLHEARLEFKHSAEGRLLSESGLFSSIDYDDVGDPCVGEEDISTTTSEDSATKSGHIDVSEYLYEYSYTEDGFISRQTYDYGEIDGILEREIVHEYDETNRVLSVTEYFYYEEDVATSIVTYLYLEPEADTGVDEEEEAYALVYEQEDWDGDGLTDDFRILTYDLSGVLLWIDTDRENDGVWDEHAYYVYNSDGRIIEYGNSSLTPTEDPYTTITAYEYDADGNVTYTYTDFGNDGVQDSWNRNTYEDGHLIREVYGFQTEAIDIGGVIDTERFERFYTRDAEGRWTSRVTTAYESGRTSGTENATYNIDGHWAGWEWFEEGGDGVSAFMTTACIGPISPDTIESF